MVTLNDIKKNTDNGKSMLGNDLDAPVAVLDPKKVRDESRKMYMHVMSFFKYNRSRIITEEQNAILQKEYSFLKENCVHLYDMIYRSTINFWPMLTLMLDNLEKINNERSKDEADTLIGKTLAEKYIDPVIKNQ